MRVTDIQFLLKLLLILLISQIPYYMVFSQSSDNKKVNKISVKMIKTVNGKTEVIDTVLVADDYVQALSGLKGFKADTALLKRLNKSYIGIQKVDSILNRPGMKASLDNWNISIKSDSVLYKRFKDRDIQVYKLEKHLDSASIKHLNKHFRYAKRDTVGMMRFKDRQIYVMGDDSSRHRIISRNYIFKNGDTVRFEKLMPGKSFILSADSIQVFRLDKESLNLRGADRKELIRSKVTKVPDAEREKLESAGYKIESKEKNTLEIESINFYPNPNIGRFMLAFNLEQKGDVSINIMNSTGQEIYNEKVRDFSGNYRKEIDITGVSKGIYYLQVVQGKRIATRKIVIQ